MSAATTGQTAEDVKLVNTAGRPARSKASERGQHDAASVLCLTTGAGPQHSKEECVPQHRPALTADEARRAARPIRDPNPARNAAYWARIDAIVDAAPPLEDWQRAAIRVAFHGTGARRAAV